MRLVDEFRGPGVGDPDLEGTQSLITQSNSVFGDSLHHVAVSHERMLHVTGAWSVPRVQGSTGEGHPNLSLFQPQLLDSGWQNQPMPNLLRSTTIAVLAATPITALSLFSAGIGSAEPLDCASGQFWDPITNTCQTPQPAQDCASGEYWNALSNVCRPLGQL